MSATRHLSELLDYKSNQLDQAIRSTLNDLNNSQVKNSKLVIENSFLKNHNTRLTNENNELKAQVSELSKSLQLTKEILVKHTANETIRAARSANPSNSFKKFI